MRESAEFLLKKVSISEVQHRELVGIVKEKGNIDMLILLFPITEKCLSIFFQKCS